MPRFEQTYFCIAVALGLNLAAHVVIYRKQLKHRREQAALLVFPLSWSFAVSSIALSHWFARLEYAGPIGGGLGLLVSPIFAALAITFSYWSGWSLQRLVTATTLIARGKPTHSSRQIVVSVLVLFLCAIVIAIYIRRHIPKDYGLRAIPSENFTNSIGMPLIQTT